MYIISLFCAFTASSTFLRLTADLRKQGGEEQGFKVSGRAAATFKRHILFLKRESRCPLMSPILLLFEQPPKN